MVMSFQCWDTCRGSEEKKRNKWSGKKKRIKTQMNIRDHNSNFKTKNVDLFFAARRTDQISN